MEYKSPYKDFIAISLDVSSEFKGYTKKITFENPAIVLVVSGMGYI